PWFIAASIQFGFIPVFQHFIVDFVSSRATDFAQEQQAPIFWYARWFLESFRPGWSIFISLVLYDILIFLKTRIWDTRFIIKTTVLTYILSTFLLYSIFSNKVWWYVLPLIPTIALYIYLSAIAFLQTKQHITKLLLIVIVSSLPVFFGTSNTVALTYGVCVVLLNLGILFIKIRFPENKTIRNSLLFIAIILPLLFFYFRFPIIQPTYPEAKQIGIAYQEIDDPYKCLLVEGMPYEAILFYSNAKEILYLQDKDSYSTKCALYLVTPQVLPYQIVTTSERLYMYKLTAF
ncbi:MAG TPA: hypothetical protein PLS49_02460, partial [Candidatus Woesebacteria bacterium]|nr:hypothetical protein [Candidatus Woesebacteria bacterium]